MSQHRQATDPGPSRISVVTTFLMALGAAAETFWILAGPGDDPRHLAGGIMGFTVVLLLVVYWARQMGERETARRRVRLRAAHASWTVSASEPDPVATQPLPVGPQEPELSEFPRMIAARLKDHRATATWTDEVPIWAGTVTEPLRQLDVPVFRPEDTETAQMPRVDV